MFGLHPAYWFAAGCCYVVTRKRRKLRRNAPTRGVTSFVAQSQARHPAEWGTPTGYVLAQGTAKGPQCPQGEVPCAVDTGSSTEPGCCPGSSQPGDGIDVAAMDYYHTTMGGPF